MAIVAGNYYVYIVSLDEVIRYIGMGRGKRYEHVNSGTSHVRNMNFEVLRNDRTFDIERIERLTEIEALKLEFHFIEKYKIESDGGTLWNISYGGKGFNGKHTSDAISKIKAASKNMWDGLSKEEYKLRIKNFKESENSGRFIKGVTAHNKGTIGSFGKTWKLSNKVTGEEFIFVSKTGFVKDNPQYSFISGMSPNKEYVRGRKKDLYLEIIE